MTHRTTTVPPAAVEALRRTVAGHIVYPSDPSFDALVGHTPAGRSPAVAVVPATEDGVRAAVTVARAHGLRVAGPTAAVPLGEPGPTMLVLTHLLVAIELDRVSGTAVVAPGATWDRLASSLLGSGLEAGVTADAGTRVLDTVVTRGAAVLSARVVRADGFVHVVADPAAPVDDPGPWIVTALVLPLVPTTHHAQETRS
jgi:hypothetical protein